MRRRGARPEALVFGGTFWLVGVPFVALPFVYLAWPLVLARLGCAGGCRWSEDRSGWPIVVAIVLAAVFLGLTGLFVLARRRPTVGYPLFGAIGVAILVVAFAFAIVEREPLLLPIVLSWPGWTGIAFVTAAHRARQPPGPTPVWRPW